MDIFKIKSCAKGNYQIKSCVHIKEVEYNNYSGKIIFKDELLRKWSLQIPEEWTDYR